MAGEGMKEMSSNYCSKVVKIVLKRCPRTEKAVKELLLQNGDNDNDPHHPCPICGSVSKCNGSEKYGMSPVQMDLFKNLIFALTLEAGGGGSDSLTLMDLMENSPNFGCERCMDKFVMLESLQNEISLLENKVEEILSQLRKTISDRRGLISQTNLTEAVTEAEATIHPPPLGDMDEEDGFEPFTQIMAEAEEVGLDLKPVILDFQDEVDEGQPMKLPEDDDLGDYPLGDVNSVFQEHYPANKPENGDHAGGYKSRLCKIRATEVISAILCNDDNVDGDGDDKYSPIIESDTDSDDTNELELESDTRTKPRKHQGEGIPSHSSAIVQKEDGNHISKVCGKQVIGLTRHMKTHSRFPCKSCNNSFPTKADLDEHKKTEHTGGQPYFCTKCGNKFSRGEGLRRHLQLTTCNPDKDEMDKAKQLSRKYKKDWLARTKSSNFKCEFCAKTFLRKDNLIRHKSKCGGDEQNRDKPYSCSKCGNRFSQKVGLRRHLETTICNPDKDEMDKAKQLRRKSKKDWLARRKSAQFKCEFCLKTFLIKDNLIRHNIICNPNKDEMDKAKQLRRKYHKDWLAKTKSSNLKCEFCAKTFLIMDNLIRHKSKCGGDEHPDNDEMDKAKQLRRKYHKDWLARTKSSNLKCHFCLKTFLIMDNLIRHKSKCGADEHNRDKPYLCSKCGNRFRREVGLRTHLEHTICNPDKDEMVRARGLKSQYMKDFVARRKLSQFKCELCAKTFLKKDNLIQHVANCTDKDGMVRARKQRNQYMKDWLARRKLSQFKCEFCAKTFLRKDNLALHISKCPGH